jgi:ribosomal protein S18 acetylase RimI-like enzyme
MRSDRRRGLAAALLRTGEGLAGAGRLLLSTEEDNAAMVVLLRR